MQIQQEEPRKFQEEYSLAERVEQDIVSLTDIALGMLRKNAMCHGVATLEHGFTMPKLRDIQQAERLELAQLW
jgi:hypothetical protein